MRKAAQAQMPTRDQAVREGEAEQDEHQAADEGGQADRATAMPTRCASPLSSVLARSISYLISWDTSLAARATRSPSD